jgi:hypothetical protein
MNALHDKTVDCLDIRFPVPLGDAAQQSSAFDFTVRPSRGARATTFREIVLFDCRRATWGKPSPRAIAPRLKYPFAPPICEASPPPRSRRCDARRFSGLE